MPHTRTPRSVSVFALLLAGCQAATIPEALVGSDTGSEDTGIDAPDPALCPLPSVQEQFPGPTPPNPWDEWAQAPDCLQVAHDVIVIVGCPSEGDGSPSDCQQGRVDKALRLSEAGYGDRFITTGAAVANEHVEAHALRDLLVAAGVSEQQVFVEPLAEHTDENLYWSTQIMAEHGWTSALVVSEPEHLVYTAACDANCCVGLGRLAIFAWPVAEGSDQAATYLLTPPAADVTEAECDHLTSPLLFVCTNLPDRRACEHDFQL